MSDLNPEVVLKQYEKAIYKAAHTYHNVSANNPRIGFEDLVSEGQAIAIKAAQSFDETKASFHTHLTTALDRELTKYLINNGYDLSVTEYAEREEFHAAGNKDRLKREANARVHLDSTSDINDIEGHTFPTYGEMLPSGFPSPEEILIKNESLEILREELNALPDRERHVISLRWFEKKKLREIAEEMNVSKQTIHGWERSAMDKLEKRLKLRLGNDPY